MLENRMLIDSEWEDLETHTNWDEYYDKLAEIADREYEDSLFKEEN